jgi:hypothetical protein
MTDEVSIKTWTKRGISMVNTFALDYDDPDHPYNQIVSQGKDPEEYGIEHPLDELFKNYSRSKLIERIVTLEKQLLNKEWI